MDYSDSSTNPPLSLTVASGSDVYLQSQADSTLISATGVNVGAHTFDLSTLAGPILQAPGGAITASSVILDTSVPASDIGSSTTPILLQGPDNNPVTLTAFTGGGNAYFNTQANSGTGYTGSIALGVVNTGNFTLAAQGPVSQVTADTITANNLTVSTTGAASTVMLGNTGNQISNTASFNTTGAGSDVSFTNDASQVFIGASSVTGNFSVNATNASIQLGSEGAPPIAATGTLALTANGFINQAGTSTTYLSATGLSASATGHIRLTNPNNQISGNVTLNVTDSDEEGVQLVTTRSITLAGTNSSGDQNFSVTATDPVGMTNPSLTVTGSINAGGTPGDPTMGFGQSGGAIALQADGDITIANTGSIQTAGNQINLTAGGSITVNGTITDSTVYYGEGSVYATAPGQLYLEANTNGNATTTLTNGIYGGGLMTAGYIALSVDDGLGEYSLGGPIGTVSTPIQIANDSDNPVALTLSTYGANVYVKSTAAGSYDGSVNLLQVGLTAAAEGVPAGSLTLTAAGAISQTMQQIGELTYFPSAIQAHDLNLTVTAAGGISLPGGNDDASNQVTGTVRFTTASGDVNFVNGGTVTLGSSSVGGNLTVNAGEGQILIADALQPSGVVHVSGSVSLTAGEGIVEGSSYQGFGTLDLTNAIPIQAGNGLTAISDFGDIQLTALNDVTGTLALGARQDPPNDVFNGPGNVAFTNRGTIAIGESPESGATIRSVYLGGGFASGSAPSTIMLTSTTGNIDIEANASMTAQSTIALIAGSDITEASTASISQAGDTAFSAIASGNISLSSPTNTISGVISLQSPNTINLVNSVDTTVGAIGNFGNGNISIAGNGAVSFSGGSITAGSLQLTGFTTINATGVSVGSLSAAATGDITVSTLGGVKINNLTGGVGIQTSGAVTLNTLGTITSATGIVGSIAAGNLTASVNAGGGFGIFLGDGMNAVTGSVTLNAPGQITFFNSVNTNIFRANYIPTSTAVPAASVDIEAFGASTPTLTIGAGVNQNGTSISGNSVTLRGMGGILQSGTGAVAGSNITLISGFGTIGTATAPILVQADGAISAIAVNKDIDLAFTLPQGATSATMGLGLPLISTTSAAIDPITGLVTTVVSSSSPGFSAGTGNINISAPSVFVDGFTTITAASLNISSSAGVELDDVEVGSLSAAASAGGPIDISSVNGFQLNNSRGGPAISTTGDVSLDVSSGSITQATGASGAIIAGTLSSFAVDGNNFNNAANAISGDVEIGSLANTTLVNSLTTNLVVALASGTLTVQSAGDLVIAGPTIAALSANGTSTGTNFKDAGSDTNDGSGNGGININGTTAVSAATLSQLNGNLVSLASSGDGIVLAAGGSFINNAGPTALLLPNGARFLVYANQFSTSVLGGLTTVGDGIFNTSYPTPITASGSRFIFAGSGSLIFTPAFTPSDVLHGNTTTAPVLVGFVTATQPPPRNPPPLLPPPPPPLSDLLTVGPLASPPPVQSPLADNNAEQPTSSDQTTSEVANSLDGGGSSGARGGRVVIPGMLANTPPPAPPPADVSALSSFGNSSLWQ